jgi:HPt (histidine-containing phosphotransfer) domain-containing protein
MSKLVSHVDAATPAADDAKEPRVPASAARAPLTVPEPSRSPLQARLAESAGGDGSAGPTPAAGCDGTANAASDTKELRAPLRHPHPEGAAASPMRPPAPLVDWRQLASRLGDDDETAKRVLRHFVEQADAQLRRLGEAADSADSRAIEMEAHRLRGVLAWIGAEYAASVAADIEGLCRAGNTGRAAELCEKLRQETESVVAAIREAGDPPTG